MWAVDALVPAVAAKGVDLIDRSLSPPYTGLGENG